MTGKKILTLLIALVAVSLTVSAQIRGYNIQVLVTPDHQDWNYEVGETAEFTIRVLKSSTLMDNVTIEYEQGPEMYPEGGWKQATLKTGELKVKGKMTRPGFYRVKARTTIGGKEYSAWCTAAFSPEQLEVQSSCPADFDEFWARAIADARNAAPLNPHKELLPERCTEDVNVYEVSFNNDRWDGRMYGILCVPVKPGKYPALLRVPGAGVRPYSGDVWTAQQGCITLEIGIHGIPVTMDQQVYDRLAYSALNGYWETNLDQPDKNYYKRVFTGAIRAIDYIEALGTDPSTEVVWDGENLCVTGSSQGGMLSLVCAGLDPRVSCYGAVHAAMCDHAASLNGVACGWPHYFYGQSSPDKAKVEGSGYYDGVNFAKRIKCKGWFSFGYNDDVVPPTTAYATYNCVSAPKELSVYQQTAHFWYQEQWDEWVDWIWTQLGIKN